MNHWPTFIIGALAASSAWIWLNVYLKDWATREILRRDQLIRDLNDSLKRTQADFDRAIEWLKAGESYLPERDPANWWRNRN